MYVCMHVCMYVCLLACLPVCLFACLLICLSVCLFACLSVCLFVCLFVCLSVSLSLCLFVWFISPNLFSARPLLKGAGTKLGFDLVKLSGDPLVNSSLYSLPLLVENLKQLQQCNHPCSSNTTFGKTKPLSSTVFLNCCSLRDWNICPKIVHSSRSVKQVNTNRTNKV